jgi:membrane dipeptidase
MLWFPKYPVVSRRSFLTAGACALGAPFIKANSLTSSVPEYSELTVDVIQRSTVIDMLGLLTLDYKKLSGWEATPDRFQNIDYQRIKDSGITIFHPAVGFTGGDVYQESLSDITGWNLFIASHSDKFLRVDRAPDLMRAKEQGKIGIVIGQQNSEHFRTVEDVDRFYRMGQRVSQLTYNDNLIGGGSTGVKNLGLTDYGAQVVQRMNQLGMAVDVSHCSDRTTLDAIEASTKPVLVTHANCRALVPGSARCRTDEAIRKLAAKGGVLGVTMVRFFVGSGGSVTIENVLDHIDHVVKVAGIEHVGIGSDVDLDGRDRHGPGSTAGRKNDLDGVQYARKIFDLTEGLVRRNYSRQNIELILSGNFRRVLSQIWTT